MFNPASPDRQPWQPSIPMPGTPQPGLNQIPQLGEAIYPGDETSSATEGLVPPATAGAEQDMQMASLEHHLGVSATSGAQEVPEAESPDTSDNTGADTPPAPTTGGGGAKPPGPPKPPIPAAEGGEPDDESLRSTPDHDVWDIFGNLPEAPRDVVDAELSPAAKAQIQFDMRVVTPPTLQEVVEIQDKQRSVNWLETPEFKSPIRIIFGAPDAIDDRDALIRAIQFPDAQTAPIDADRIVDRQLRSLTGTLSEILAGIKACGDIAELTTTHAGRTVVQQDKLGERSGEDRPTTVFTSRHIINPIPSVPPLVEQFMPPTGRPKDVVRIDTPEGEVHLVANDGTHRIRVQTDTGAGTVNITREQKYTIEPGDTAPFETLRADLTRHQSLLLDAAKHAGFTRTDIVDETGNVNMGFLRTEIGSATGNADFWASLPEELRSALEVSAELIARQINPNRQEQEDMIQRCIRIGHYFRTILGHRDI